MPWRFRQALDLALQDLQGVAGAEGVLFFGSALAGTAGPTSDLDLYVVLSDDQELTRISLRMYVGISAEVHFAPLRVWRERLTSSRVVMMAFATGEALLDRTGAVAELSAEARRLREAGPPALSAGEVDRWRFRLTDLADDLEDVAGQPAEERMLAARLVYQCLEAYVQLNRLWGDTPKKLIAFVERHDPELGRLVRAFFAGDLDPHLPQRMVDRVLGPHGGRMDVWEGPPER